MILAMKDIRHFLLLTVYLLAFVFTVPGWAQYTPGGLYSVARAGNIEGLKAALEEKPSRFRLNNALEAAVIGDQPEAIRLLVEHGAQLDFTNRQGTALLVNTIMLGSDNAAAALIDLGADPDITGYHRTYQGYTMNWHWTPLMAAAYQGKPDFVRQLVASGADVAKEGYSVSEDEPENAADIAAYSGRLDILKYLLDQGAKLDDATIFKATRGGHLEVVKYLIKKGADVDRKEPSRGKTLLMEAAWWGHLELAQYLIKAGADITLTDNNGYTALSDAAANDDGNVNDRLKIIKTLIANGADVRRSDRFRETPLMRAKDPKVIKFLVEAGAR